MKKHANINLKIARIAAGLTRDELAAEIGRSPRFVRRLEHGDDYARLTPEIKKRIAAAIGTPENLLFPEHGGGE